MIFRRQSARRGAFVITGLNLAAKLLGFVRELIIAYFFGAGAVVDGFNIALTLHNLFSLPVRNAVQDAGIPLMVRKGPNFVKAVSGLALAVAAGLSVLIFAAAPWLVKLVAPFFSQSSSVWAVVQLRAMAVLPVAAVALQLAVSWNHANRHFALAGAGGLTVNVVCVLALLVLVKPAGGLAVGLAWAGGFSVAALILWSLSWPEGLKITFPRWRVVKPMVKDSSAIIASAVFAQVFVAVDRVFASWLPVGSVSCLGYGWRVFIMASALLNGLVLVHFVKFSELAKNKQTGKMLVLLKRGLVLALGIMGAASLVVFLVARPLVSLMFQRGAFDQTAVAGTAGALAFYGMGLFPLSANTMFIAFYRSLRRQWLVTWVSVAGAVLNIALDALLVRPFGVNGIAAATATGYGFSFFLYWFFLRRVKA